MSAERKHGLLLVDKEPGGTSHDAVQQARRLLREKKIGHCGTLDPAATGLLVMTVGQATRLTRFLIRAPKIYEGVIQLGAATDTYDAEGQVTSQGSTEGIDFAAVEAAMAELEGTFEQLVPPFSAKKVKGVKLYEMARRGEEVPREAKQVTVYEFSSRFEAAHWAAGKVAFRLSCASGTYARTLAHDLGQKLGCGAHLCALRRLAVGPFEVDRALMISELRRRRDAALASEAAEGEEAGELPPEGTGAADAAAARRPRGLSNAELDSAWIPFDQITLPFDEVIVEPQQELRIQHGQTVLVRGLAGEEGDWVKLVNRRHQFIAVGSVVERIGTASVGTIQPKVVFK